MKVSLKSFYKISIFIGAGLLCFQGFCLPADARTFNVGIIEDGANTRNRSFIKALKSAIQKNSTEKDRIHFSSSYHYNGNYNVVVINRNIKKLLHNPDVDIILSLGPISGRLLGETIPLTKPVFSWGVEFPVLTGLLDPVSLKPKNENWTTSHSPSVLTSTVITSRKVFDFRKITYICASFLCDNLSATPYSESVISALRPKGTMIVLSEKANVYAAPDNKQPLVDMLQKGQQFPILGATENWIRISSGWISRASATIRSIESLRNDSADEAISSLGQALAIFGSHLGFKLEMVIVSPQNFQRKIKALETNVVYVGELYGFSESEEDRFYQTLIENKIPSITQLGRYGVQKGALVSIFNTDGSTTGQIFAGKLSQFVGGTPIQKIPVIDPWNIDLIFNPATAKKINFDIPIVHLLEGRLYKDMTKSLQYDLAGAVQRGVKENYEILIDQLEQKQIHILSDQSKSSYLPQITASYTLTEAEDSATTGAAQISLTQNLFSAEANSTIDIANHSLEMARQNSSLIKERIIEEIIIAYLDVLSQLEVVNSRTEHLRYFRKLKKTVQFRYNIRSTGRSDVLRIDMEFKNGRFEMINSMEQLHRAKVTLNTILKQDIDAEISLDPGFFAQNPAIERSAFFNKYRKPSQIKALQQFLLEKAMHNSLQLKLSVAQLDQAKLEKKQSISKFYPTLQMGITWTEAEYIDSLTLTGDSERTYLDNNDLTWNAQLQLSVPLFNRGARFHEIKEINTKIQEMSLRVAKTKADLGQTIKLLLNNHLMNHDRMLEIFNIVDSADKNLSLGKISYEEGIISLKELIELQSSTIVASINATITKFQFYRSLVKLLRMVGRIELIYKGIDHEESQKFFKEMSDRVEQF